MARYWVGGAGNWDASDTTHWAASSGGAGGQSVPTSSDDVIFDSASNAVAYTCTVAASVSCANLTMGNPAAGNLTLGGSGVTLDVFGNLVLPTGMAVTNVQLRMRATSGTATITTNGVTLNTFTINGAGTFQLADDFKLSGNNTLTLTAGTFDPNGKTVTFSAATSPGVSGAFTFYNLTVTPTTPGKVTVFSISNNITVTNLFTVSAGATVTNRVLVKSNTIGTAVTITSASNSIANADFQDITAAGAASWNLAAITGLSGDCGGNTGITFTTPANQHFTNVNGGNWSTTANWTSRVPLPQDDVFLDTAFGASKTVTADMPRLGKNVSFTGATWTTAFTWTNSVGQSLFGSLTFITGMTLSGSNSLTFGGRSAFTLNGGGLTIERQIIINCASGNSVTLAANLILGTTRTLSVTSGTFSVSASNYVLSTGNISTTAGSSIVLGTATHLLTGTTTFSFGASTVTAGTSTLKFTDTSNTAISFSPQSNTFYNVWISRGASTGTFTFQQTAAYNDIKDDGTAAHTLKFALASTTILTTFTVSGNGAGNEITLDSTNAGAVFALYKNGGGQISCDYLNIQHSYAVPSNTWYAGTHSVNNQAVAVAGDGWIFSAPNPAVSNFLAFM